MESINHPTRLRERGYETKAKKSKQRNPRVVSFPASPTVVVVVVL